jgi:predicted flap endonuclease-1-like 5' DNA nuclease
LISGLLGILLGWLLWGGRGLWRDPVRASAGGGVAAARGLVDHDVELRRLRGELDARDATIAELRAELAAKGSGVASGSAVGSSGAVAALADTSVAHGPDDLEHIFGVGPKLAALLRDEGISTFREVALWTTADVARFSEKIPAFKDRIEKEGWIVSAQEEHFKKYGERIGGYTGTPESMQAGQKSVHHLVDEGAETVDRTGQDDLVAINGVGPKLAAWLHEHGVHTFREVARWSEADVERFSALLPDFQERIRDEGWVASAAEEHFKKYGERI